MEGGNRTITTIEDIKMLLLQKGYRRSFRFEAPQILLQGSVKECLDCFLKLWTSGSFPDGTFHLSTLAPYNDSISYKVNVNYTEQNGFSIDAFLVTNLKTGDYRLFRLRNNNELPGSQTLTGLFPKQKIWDRIKRGKI